MTMETSRPKQGVERLSNRVLAEDHLFKAVQRLYDQESGKIPDPLQIRAAAIVSALGLPTGQYSALGVDERGQQINQEKDKVIAKYLTNHPGVVIQEDPRIVSSDFRDIYPAGLPPELKQVLDRDTLAIMEIEYEHAKYTKEKFGDTKNDIEADTSINYFRMAGGIDLFLKAYFHNPRHHLNHKDYLRNINKHGKIISIEGYANVSFGESLDIRWSTKRGKDGDYSDLMHEAVDAGFNGYFAEVDARDKSRIRMDSVKGDVTEYEDMGKSGVVITLRSGSIFPTDLPHSFFEKYFSFLQREHPILASKVGSQDKLREILSKQSMTSQGLYKRVPNVYFQGRYHGSHAYLNRDGSTSMEPTFLEFGQKLFTDALAAIKLHLIAKLMADRHLPKGPIIDYEGAAHLSSKLFFLRYPGYAMEVVLRTINELMAGPGEGMTRFLGAFQKDGITKIERIFENPNWKEAIKEIVRLSLKSVENEVPKVTSIGLNQRELIDHHIDFLRLYKINPAKIVPSTAQIVKLRQKLAKEERQRQFSAEPSL